MPLITAIAGQYVGSYFSPANPSTTYPIGLLSDDGFELSWTTHAKLVNKTSGYGTSLVEGIYTGSDWRIRFRCLEYMQSGALALAWPWQALNKSFQTGMPNVGARFTDNRGGLLLTAVTGTPAETSSAISSFTANAVIASNNNQFGFSLTSKLRSLPLELLLLPSTSGRQQGGQNQFTFTSTTTTWFTTT